MELNACNNCRFIARSHGLNEAIKIKPDENEYIKRCQYLKKIASGIGKNTNTN